MSRRIYTEIINPNGNFLFTVDDLNNADSRTKCLPCKCLHCSKIFYISKHDYQLTLHENNNTSYKFCSSKCSTDHNIIRQQLFCEFCGKPITRAPSGISEHNFCSSSCAAKFNNKGRIHSKESNEKCSKSLLDYYEHKPLNNLQHQTTRFKTGYHTSWEGKTFYFRSSYELDYCLKLDSLQIPYEMETLRIRYFNTRKNREAIAIPDFYLKETNTIIEVKSNFTYIQQDMIDRSSEYKRLGYNFKLVLEHKEYNDCPKSSSKTIYNCY